MSTSNINNGVSFRALCIDTYGNKDFGVENFLDILDAHIDTFEGVENTLDNIFALDFLQCLRDKYCEEICKLIKKYIPDVGRFHGKKCGIRSSRNKHTLYEVSIKGSTRTVTIHWVEEVYLNDGTPLDIESIFDAWHKEYIDALTSLTNEY